MRSDGSLTPQAEQELYRHYGIGHGNGNGRTDARHATGERTDRDRTDRTDRTGDDAMVRHEENLRVGTETEETGRVALRKYVVTEDQTVTVPVSHEEVRLEREPIDGTEATARPGAMGEAEHEVTLHRERPVVDKTTEAVEKVRLGTRTVTDDEKVSDTVRKERIEVDDPQHALPRDERRS